jgi:hypothetical protein
MGDSNHRRAIQQRSRRQRFRLATFGLAIVAASLCASYANATLRITEDTGGTILEYAQRYHRVRDSGERVIIDGKCLSACTMVIGMVPRNRICATPNAILGFHAAFRRTWGIAPRSVELGEAGAAVNDVKRPSRFGQQRGNLFPSRSKQQARPARPEVA